MVYDVRINTIKNWNSGRVVDLLSDGVGASVTRTLLAVNINTWWKLMLKINATNFQDRENIKRLRKLKKKISKNYSYIFSSSSRPCLSFDFWIHVGL